MGRLIYFTGGARSGKSREAERYIKVRNYQDKIYLATSIPFDKEMKDRIKKHKDQRGENWKTLEGYENLIDLVRPNLKGKGVILLDCITNLVSNMMILNNDYDWDNISMDEVNNLEEKIIKEIESFLEYIKSTDYDCVIVSNELGMGLVPTYPLGRYFRDICGRANQIVARESKEVYFLVSGILRRIK